jgi:hypothetical protein
LVKKSRREQPLNKEVSEEVVVDVEELEQLEDILALLQSKADGPQVRGGDENAFEKITADLREPVG